MSPRHHPPDEVLLDYAAGAASPGVALLVATHATLCPHCRGRLETMDRLGGALLEMLPPRDISAGARERAMARLDASPGADSAPAAPMPVIAVTGGVRLPRALGRKLGADIASLPWKPVMGGVDQVLIDSGADGSRTRLMRIRAGRSVPAHTHRGLEMVCVLDGGFADIQGHYGPGDVATADDGVDHQPRADAEGDCLCLAVAEAPVRLTGRLWRLLNPFVKF